MLNPLAFPPAKNKDRFILDQEVCRSIKDRIAHIVNVIYGQPLKDENILNILEYENQGVPVDVGMYQVDLDVDIVRGAIVFASYDDLIRYQQSGYSLTAIPIDMPIAKEKQDIQNSLLKHY
jgi:hypothetical protein